MSFTLHGTPVSGGIAIGHAHLVSHASLEVAHYDLPAHEVADESARFAAAIATARNELETLRGSIPAGAPQEVGAFLDLHRMFLDDRMLALEPRRIIETEACNAEWALKVQLDAMVAQFEAIEDAYLRERKVDVIQVAERVMKVLMGQPRYVPPPLAAEAALILVAHDLSPADVIQFKQHQFASFLTDLGGVTSHTAVVARSLNIPSIVALHHARTMIREDELLIVDGAQGVIIVDPDPQVLAEYRLKQNQWSLEKQKLKRLRTARASTLDGIAIDLQANIELPDDVPDADEAGAMGIGLFRSEFLFLNRPDLPDEEEQFEAYRKVVEAMQGRPVTIRTYDLGADKQAPGEERITMNPALGLRAIRLCLVEPTRFQAQLRALLRASHYGKVRILIPMICGASEATQTMQQIRIARATLDAAGIPYDRDVAVGCMVEIPAAALAVPMFARHFDFLSIGTNDLIQYTLAVDRTDDTVAHLYDQLRPAVLNLIARAIHDADELGVPIALCGEMAGDVAMTRLLLGLGLRTFSMHPAQILAVKQRVLTTSVQRATAAARRLLKADDPERIRALLDRINEQ